MPLFINKIYNVCGAWGEIINSSLAEFEDLKAAFLEVNECEYSDSSVRVLKERISEALRNRDWQSKYPLAGGIGKFTKPNFDPKRMYFLAKRNLLLSI